MVEGCLLAQLSLMVLAPFIILTMTNFIELILLAIGPMAIEMAKEKLISEMGAFIQVIYYSPMHKRL